MPAAAVDTPTMRVIADRKRLLQMRAGLIRAVRELDALLGFTNTFVKDAED